MSQGMVVRGKAYGGRAIPVVLALGGLMYSLVGAALLLAPAWFHETIGRFPPFNRHYLGDLGAFHLPLGVGLLVAACDPSRYRGIIGVAAATSLLHVANHLYDAAGARMPADQWLFQVPVLGVAAVALTACYLGITRSGFRARPDVGNAPMS